MTLPRVRRARGSGRDRRHAPRNGTAHHRRAPSPLPVLRSLQRVTAVLDNVLKPTQAVWATLIGLTAGEGLAFNRAFVLRTEGTEIRGWFGIGPPSRDEAAELWRSLDGHKDEASFAALLTPTEAVMSAEQRRHADILRRLSHPMGSLCMARDTPFVARPGDPNPCTRHWMRVLDSRALAVVPIRGGDSPWGVILADNFVTLAPIPSSKLQAAETLATALRVALDRTELVGRLADEHRRRLAAEQSAALLEAAQDLAHDLKNPLAIAGGLARELAAAPPANLDELDRQLQAIASAVGRAEERIAHLAETIAAHAARVAVEPLDVGELAERVVELFRPTALRDGVRLQCYHPSRPLRALAAREALERCLENLIGNALQACVRAGATVRVAARGNADTITLEVADDGPPLPPPLRDAPFSGGITTHRGGTGVGLASVQRLVAAMGGRIEYDENEPGWVRFTIYLRRAT